MQLIKINCATEKRQVIHFEETPEMKALSARLAKAWDELGCKCPKPSQEYYVPDNTVGAHQTKHHWNCGVCHGLVQVG